MSIILGFPESIAAARRLGDALDVPCEAISVHHFPDRESLVRIPASAETVILYQSLDDPDAKLVQLILAAAAARDAGARRIVLVAPYLGYMRQDKAFHPGEAISQRVIGNLLARYFDALLTVDPHLHRIAALSEVVPGIPAISVSAAPLLTEIIDSRQRPVIVAPDGEAKQWAEGIARPLSLDLLTGSKQRHGDRRVTLTIERIDLVCDRPVILVDDLISSGTTLNQAASLLQSGKAMSVEAVATHCLASARDLEHLAASGIRQIFSSDSVDGPTSRVSLAPLLANALRSQIL